MLVGGTDPIHEEIEFEEQEDAEFMSDCNFYQNWERHKRSLMTQDEELRLIAS